MKFAFKELLQQGGPVMLANLGLSVVLYSGCFGLLLRLVLIRRRLQGVGEIGETQLPAVRQLQEDLQDLFRRQRLPLGAMIAAAPLIGLLGTVSGMINTFESLSSGTHGNAMEGLASGISEALLNTEAGLAVAIPAVLLLYYAHRQTQKGVRQLVQLESLAMEAR